MFNHWQITIRHLLRGSPFLFFSFFSSISFVIERRSMKSLCIHSTSSSHASSSFLLFYFYFLSESSLLFPYRFPSSIFFFLFYRSSTMESLRLPRKLTKRREETCSTFHTAESIGKDAAGWEEILDRKCSVIKNILR